MNPICYIDAVSVGACLTALVLVIRGWKKPHFLTAVPVLLVALLFLMTFYALSLFLEWSGITGSIDLLEDFGGVFIPVLWAFVFYAVFKNDVEEDLIASREHFRELVEGTSDWIWEIDATLRYTYVSPRVRTILGFEPEEIQGKRLFDLMSPEEADRVQKLFEPIYRGKRSAQQLENINLHKDGHEVVLEMNAVPVLNKAGQVTGYRGVNRDITVRKYAEETIIAERDKAQGYLDIAGVMILALDAEGRVVLLNRRGCEILQCAEEEVLGRNWFEAFLPFSYRDIAKTFFESLIDSGEVKADYFEHPVLTRRGSERLLAWHVVVVRDSSGVVTGMLCSGEDITEARASEVAARESDERLRVALSAVEMGTWRWSPVTNEDTRDANLNALLGLEPVESTQNIEEFFHFVHPDDRDEARAVFDRAILKQEPFQVRFRVVQPDGRVRWVLDQGRPFYDFNGRLEYVTGVVVDITKRQRTINALKESELRYRKFIQLSGEGIARFEFKEPMPIHLPVAEQIQWISEKGILAECNDLFAQMYGYQTAMDFIGLRIFDLWNDAAVAKEVITQLIEDGYHWKSVETHETTQAGIEKYFLNNLVSIIEDDHLTGHWLTQIDITDEVARRKALQFTQFAVDHSGEAAFWMKPDATFFYVNDAACRSLGYSHDELLQMSLFEIDPDIKERQWREIWDTTRDLGVNYAESRHKRKDGHIFPIEIHGNFVVYDGKEYSCAFVRDISDRKAAEQMRELLMEQLREHNDELQSIIYTATHDLRSPLVNIAGFVGELEKDMKRLSDMIERESLSADGSKDIAHLLEGDVAESLSLIQSGSRQMGALLNGLLRLTRIGSAPIAVRPLDMNTLLNKVVDGLQYQINESGAHVNIEPELPRCQGDEVLLGQVFTNLLDNAIKYRSPDRKTVIEVSASVSGEMVEYRVIDNGIGIEQDDTDKVFELFYRLGLFEDKDGEGIGLTIVRRILNRLNGSVSLTSQPGQGTTVRVQLPKA